jgi:hypothetical protein
MRKKCSSGPQAMLSAASTLSRAGRAWEQARIAPMSRAKAKAMAGKGEDQNQGLAEQSLNTSVVHPNQDGPGRQGHGNRGLTDNDQREGLEKTAPDRRKPNDQRKP